jgi:hypothetical protein
VDEAVDLPLVRQRAVPGFVELDEGLAWLGAFLSMTTSLSFASKSPRTLLSADLIVVRPALALLANLRNNPSFSTSSSITVSFAAAMRSSIGVGKRPVADASRNNLSACCWTVAS